MPIDLAGLLLHRLLSDSHINFIALKDDVSHAH